jgi:hypothetical protein
VVISGASQSVLPSQTVGQPFNLVIRGTGFGSRPQVVLSGYDVAVVNPTPTAISINIATRPAMPPEEPIVLIVRNPDTGQEASRMDLFTLGGGTTNERPVITSITPSKGTRADFPVIITGTNFPLITDIQVTFGSTLMPILGVNAAGTQIQVGFPAGGLPNTGRMDVTVRNAPLNLQDIRLGGFEYVNDPQSTKTRRILGCGAGGESGGGTAGDLAVLLGVSLALGVGALATRRKSKAV